MDEERRTTVNLLECINQVGRSPRVAQTVARPPPRKPSKSGLRPVVCTGCRTPCKHAYITRSVSRASRRSPALAPTDLGLGLAVCDSNGRGSVDLSIDVDSITAFVLTHSQAKDRVIFINTGFLDRTGA